MLENITAAAARRGGSTVIYNGKPLLSSIDPIAAAVRLIAALGTPKERTLYFCPSALFGYGLKEFALRLPKSSSLICVEAHPPLARWTQDNIDAKLLDLPNAALFLRGAKRGGVLGASLDGAAVPDNAAILLCRFVREKWGQRQFRRVEELRLSGGYALEAPLYEAMLEALRGLIAAEWGNALTLTKLGRLYIRNFFRNFSRLSGAPSLKNIDFGEIPVLVAGAGPSLDALLDELPPCAPLNIIAVDTALGALCARKIKPALVVALEAQHWNLNDFCGVAAGCAEAGGVPLAMDLSALPAQAEFAVHGQAYFFWTAWTELRLFKRLRPALPICIPPLGSVGLCAVELALRLSSGPVVVSGLDFAFTLDRTHAKGTPSHNAALRRCNRLGGLYPAGAVFRAGTHSAISKSGGAIRSDAALRRYRDLFKAEFSGISRLFEIEGPGLPLGLKVLSIKSAASMLLENRKAATAGIESGDETRKVKAETENHFYMLKRELALLTEIRDMLIGKTAPDAALLENMIDDADYLWAHFPDCAAAGGRRPPASDRGFLKRLRAEIDPLISKCFTFE